MKRMSEQITAWCSRVCPMQQEQEIAVRFGLELLLENLIKFVGIFLIAGIFGFADKVAIFCLIFCPFRMLAGGIHMKTGTGCFLFMLILIGIGLLCGKYLAISQGLRWLLYGGVIALCLLYAPRDTRKNPIAFASVRSAKKYLSVLFCVFCMAVVEWTATDEIKVLAVTAIILEAVTILPVVDYINENKFQKRRAVL